MAAETIPLYCTRVDEWNTIIVEGFIVKSVLQAKQQENVPCCEVQTIHVGRCKVSESVNGTETGV